MAIGKDYFGRGHSCRVFRMVDAGCLSHNYDSCHQINKVWTRAVPLLVGLPRGVVA